MDEFDAIERRIRTLTTVVHHLGHRGRTNQIRRHNMPEYEPQALDHFATLLAVTNPDESTNAIAASGSATTAGIRLVVVTQSPQKKQAESDKASQLHSETGEGAKLVEHIQDLWSALSAHDTHTEYSTRNLLWFAIRRALPKLSARIFQDEDFWGFKVEVAIRAWTPIESDLIRQAPRWVPRAVEDLIIPGMVERTSTDRSGTEIVQWELSNATLKSWAWLLAHIVEQLKHWTRVATGTNQPANLPDSVPAFVHVDLWCRRLRWFVSGKHKVGQTLLEETSLQYSFRVHGLSVWSMFLKDDYPDPERRVIKKVHESWIHEGPLVLRHLKKIVELHFSVLSLCYKDPGIMRFARHNAAICLVRICPPDERASLMTMNELIDELSRHYPRLYGPPKYRSRVENALRDGYLSEFEGTVHPEAMLLGLLNHFSCERTPSEFANQGKGFTNADRTVLEEVAEVGDHITTPQKCCWCCLRLHQLLDGPPPEPDSHYFVYPWTPPRVGVDLAILKSLESDLWKEMSDALYPIVHGNDSEDSDPDSCRPQ